MNASNLHKKVEELLYSDDPINVQLVLLLIEYLPELAVEYYVKDLLVFACVHDNTHICKQINDFLDKHNLRISSYEIMALQEGLDALQYLGSVLSEAAQQEQDNVFHDLFYELNEGDYDFKIETNLSLEYDEIDVYILRDNLKRIWVVWPIINDVLDKLGYLGSFEYEMKRIESLLDKMGMHQDAHVLSCAGLLN
ncbi:MAG: hypothetical protein GY810_17880 [Aureispira sp.]|nr:hypothetical protein [Aureispira sp.]